jgi:hypothetical protein
VTLWIIAVFGLAVASINTWVDMASNNARTLQARADARLAFVNLTSELVYLLGTRPMTYRGLEIGTDLKRPKADDFMAVMAADYQSGNYLALDGRPYIVGSNPDYVAQLQDARGLANLNLITPPLLRRLLALYDVPETLRNYLPDTLTDWVDDDELTRLSGAEKPEYARLRRLPPKNEFMHTPFEAQSILGWDQVPQLWEADLESPLFTTCAISGFNPNTAPENILLTYIQGLTKETAAQVLSERQKSAFRNTRQFMATAGVLIPNEAFFIGLVPAGCVIVDLIHRTTNERLRFSLSLLPLTEGQPWQVDYAFKIPSRFRRTLERVNPQDLIPAPETIDTGEPGDDRTAGIR